jgi:hypothetical protein
VGWHHANCLHTDMAVDGQNAAKRFTSGRIDQSGNLSRGATRQAVPVLESLMFPMGESLSP